jgi:hypothetical protein
VRATYSFSVKPWEGNQKGTITALYPHQWKYSETPLAEMSYPSVRGGKGAFATWFSGDIDCIHGINWLPFTPASTYMGRHPAYVKTNYDRIVGVRTAGKDFSNGWGDLVVMFGALSDPAEAAKYIAANPQCSLKGGNTRAFMDHWIGTLDKLGLQAAGISADHPFAAVFTKGGTSTYAAYNFGKQPLKVTFSDGTVLDAEPRSLSVSGK